MTRKQLVLTLVCVALVVAAAAGYFIVTSRSNGNAGALPQAGDRFGVAVTADDHTMGSPKAPILMLEYAAPICPHCAHFDMDYFPELKKQYIDTGKVYYIFRVFPLQPADIAAVGIASCLPADNYFAFIDLLFRNQKEWDPEFQVPDVKAGLEKMAKIAGLDQARADGCMGDQAVAQKTSQIGQEATAKYGVSGTPTFIINGQIHGPFANWDDIKTFLDPMLKKPG